MLKWLWLSALVVALDLVSKAVMSHYLVLHEPVAIFPGFNLTLMHNPGAAFSFLRDASGWQRWFFTAIALTVSVGIVIWLRRLHTHQRWLAAGLSLILGGALGNVYDRLTLGYVVDFIEVYYREWYWPAFNVADSAISVGAVILVLDSFLNERKDGVDSKSGESA